MAASFDPCDMKSNQFFFLRKKKSAIIELEPIPAGLAGLIG